MVVVVCLPIVKTTRLTDIYATLEANVSRLPFLDCFFAVGACSCADKISFDSEALTYFKMEVKLAPALR